LPINTLPTCLPTNFTKSDQVARELIAPHKLPLAAPQFSNFSDALFAFLQGAKEFLKRHPVNFAIESYHRVDGEYTYKMLDPIFAEIGYDSISSDIFKQMFTWAKPRA
jgi:hypothetical protein